MRCARCQQESPPAAKFCAECGAALARECVRCQTQLPPGAKFCPGRAEPVAAASAPQERFASPREYTPRHIAEKILVTRSARQGGRKQMTVLFLHTRAVMH